MAVPGGGLKDGMGAKEIRTDSAEFDSADITALVSDAISGGTLAVAAGEVGTTEIADNAVTADKLAVSYNVGHFTLGTNGANVYVGFSGAGAAVTMDGSPLAIVTTMLADGDEGNEPVVVVDYSTSGFNASGNVANTCMYVAFEEG